MSKKQFTTSKQISVNKCFEEIARLTSKPPTNRETLKARCDKIHTQIVIADTLTEKR